MIKYTTGQLYLTTTKSVLGPNLLSVQWVPEVKRPGLEADQSHKSRVEFKIALGFTSASPISLHDLEVI
jgi:hypothetical protein